MRIVLATLALGVSLAASSASAERVLATTQELRENTLVMELRTGDVTIEMRPELAPNHVARIRELVRQGFYNGLKFHRVIEGFMAQTGDPLGNGQGGSGQNIKAEFSDEPFERGTVGMARAQHPDSADSQFFIMFRRTPALDGQYTIWGKVTDGMEHVDQIRRGDPNKNGIVESPDRIVRLSVEADLP